MLNYCSEQDVTNLVNVAARFGLSGPIEAVTEKFYKFLNRDLSYQAGHVEKFSIPEIRLGSKHAIWLEKRPLVADSVTVELSVSRDYTVAEDVAVDAEHYAIDLAKGKITLYGWLPEAVDGLRITYTGGYAEIDDTGVMNCPRQLAEAAAEQVGFDVARRIRFSGAANEKDDKEGRLPKLNAYGLLPDVAAVLLPYRRSVSR